MNWTNVGKGLIHFSSWLLLFRLDYCSVKLPPWWRLLLTLQLWLFSSVLSEEMLILEKLPKKKFGWVKGIGNIGGSAYDFFSGIHGSISLGRKGQKYLKKWNSAFSHVLLLLHASFAAAKVPIPMRHSSSYPKRQQAGCYLLFGSFFTIQLLLLHSTVETVLCFPMARMVRTQAHSHHSHHTGWWK